MPHDPLEHVIEPLYAAFRRVPKPPQVAGEPWELTDHYRRFLLREPLRTLTATHFRDYLFVMHAAHVGPWSEFAYFLPRLLELVAQGEIDDFNSESILRVVRAALEDHRFTPAQAEAVRAVLALSGGGFADVEDDPVARLGILRQEDT
ncbi:MULTISPECIES: hypothetical protein [Deinococcus]|uniref:Uncharacterized protein n=1 Tax=Deinococcus rufus TaxID=2136097 RepID=A0ABV7Z9R0_9DEIO|nr:hypothetical protein [Deinococcus sp. AB2017081]WQE95636.1 hypothetical protein U2P90_01790 [Deinococcus sp. AB2017081]